MDSFAHPTTGAEVGEWGDVSFSRSITNHRQAGGLSRPVFNIYHYISDRFFFRDMYDTYCKPTRSQYGR